MELPIPEDLPKQIVYDKGTLIEREIVVVFLILESLKRSNVRRLLERGKSASGLERSTRKNLRDLLNSISQIVLNQKIEFRHPFTFYSDEIASTVFNNFCMHLSFVLLRRLSKGPQFYKDMRPLISQTWIIMLLNFYNKHKRHYPAICQWTSPQHYFMVAGKYI